MSAVVAIAPAVTVVILITLAAALLEPDRSTTPLISSQSRAYFVVVGFLGFGLAIVSAASSSSRFDSKFDPVPVAIAFLVTAATTLVIVERIRPLVIVMLVILAAAIAYSSRRATKPWESGWGWLTAALTLILVWTAVGGLTSFQLQGAYALPIGVMIAGAGAIVWARSVDVPSISATMLGIIAIIGAELIFALSFIRLDPFVSATLWAAGLALTFGLTHFVVMRVSR